MFKPKTNRLIKMTGQLIFMDGEWHLRVQVHSHAGISKMGTGPMANRKIYETVPVHADDLKIIQDAGYGEFDEVEVIKTQPSRTIRLAVPAPPSDWDKIYEECKFCTSSPSNTRGVIEWLKLNYKVPEKL